LGDAMTTMREQTYLVLLALSAGPLHGYAVIGSVSELSDGVVTLGPGTLYGALDRLAGEGLVAVGGEEVVEGRHRRYYQLSVEGRDRLVEETRRRRVLAARAVRMLDLKPQAAR
jgi:DNA-binding PadR family transcriptional regulator